MERPKPTNVIEIIHFVGLVGYLKVREEFSKIASSLTDIYREAWKSNVRVQVARNFHTNTHVARRL